MHQQHSFHIPVMGIGYTLDTPLKVSRYGISSVISLVDDILLEKLRKMYAEKYKLDFQPIPDKEDDARAKRITAYLNLMHDLCTWEFEQMLRNGPQDPDYQKAMDLLPPNHTAAQLQMGSIDVNVMTKVDRENFRNKEKLPTMYNDAHAAVRGFANSKLQSSIILSAGMNPRLYSYLESFEDFYPDAEGNIKKKIVLKVSDYRSALIQGKFLAKKGLWVSEYRIESGLNCGGHAFATDGYLLGPILQEFKEKRIELTNSVFDLLSSSLANTDRQIPTKQLPLRISAQGGIGTAAEHQFFLDQYGLDSVGWGTPFLLVPEATVVDAKTLNQLVLAKEKDLYLSGISPLGVEFNNLRMNTKDTQKDQLIKKGRPGSACPKKFLALNKDFKNTGVCTASREYQNEKIKELIKEDVSAEDYLVRFKEITEKSCICVGLGTSTLIHYDLDRKREGDGVSICPGPNLAYFSKVMSLREMVGHIYGRNNVIEQSDRPHAFIKELNLYLDYLEKQLKNTHDVNSKTFKYLNTFAENLQAGIHYYQELITKEMIDSQIQNGLCAGNLRLQGLKKRIEALETLTEPIN
ncbi:MAG: hypothetical protein CMP48_24630 [Rickettsiales bacterium]|nr:hypothetical protein [Rickettsiales bacterium]